MVLGTEKLIIPLIVLLTLTEYFIPEYLAMIFNKFFNINFLEAASFLEAFDFLLKTVFVVDSVVIKSNC